MMPWPRKRPESFGARVCFLLSAARWTKSLSSSGKNTQHIREQLAAVVQPMIQDYRNRTFRWVNVYSRNDIICGSLDFYDLPGTSAPPGIENVRDKDALIPLVAHVEYWKNLTLW